MRKEPAERGRDGEAVDWEIWEGRENWRLPSDGGAQVGSSAAAWAVSVACDISGVSPHFYVYLKF